MGKRQMSESIELGIVLALAGGFMDAYSYICREQVFANAQTGNILLLGINLSEGNWGETLRYLFPVAAFAVGIMLADIVRIVSKEKKIHWRQIAVLCEAFVLLLVSFMPAELNLAANSLASFACGIQVESFRTIHGNSIATTMCIGNLRSATENIMKFASERNVKNFKKGLLYFSIIICFVLGAVIGNIFVGIMGLRAISMCSAILFVAFLMMFVNKEN